MLLNIENNQITSLDNISKNSKLKRLYCENNCIENIKYWLLCIDTISFGNNPFHHEIHGLNQI